MSERRSVRVSPLVMSAMMIAAAAISVWYVPKRQTMSEIANLTALVPDQFADWRAVPNVQFVTAQTPDSLEQELYSQVVAKAYVDKDNHLVMLLLAYGPEQSDRLQLHRPEICYVANGFRVSNISKESIRVSDTETIPVRRLLATRGERVEYITYWMRIGSKIANNVLGRQLIKLQYGLKGVIPDGLLVRTSVVGPAGIEARDIQDKFVKSLLASSSPQLQEQLTGSLPRVAAGS